MRRHIARINTMITQQRFELLLCFSVEPVLDKETIIILLLRAEQIGEDVITYTEYTILRR